MHPFVLDKTTFLNVDLRIYSKSDLRPLVDAMGDKIIELYVGREGRMFKAQLELASRHPKSPESAIREYCKLIQELPQAARELWDSARVREFDIGIEAPKATKFYWFSIAPTVIKAASEINAYIVVTIYGLMKKARKPRKAVSPK
ncbi:MAG: hypothetical protein ABSF70_12675 [Terracidiphilus sp.]